MPVHSKKINGKWRVVEPDGKIAKNAAGTAMDGGGYESSEEAIKQVWAVNMNMEREKGNKDIPPRKR